MVKPCSSVRFVGLDKYLLIVDSNAVKTINNSDIYFRLGRWIIYKIYQMQLYLVYQFNIKLNKTTFSPIAEH